MLNMHVCAGCNIALYYNTAFCYLMQRRYLDAARAFNTGLAYINRCWSLSSQARDSSGMQQW